VAAGVVDLLEAVEIDHGEAAAVGVTHRVDKRLAEADAVGEPRHAVVHRQEVDALARVHLVGDVARDADDLGDVAALAIARGETAPHVAATAGGEVEARYRLGAAARSGDPIERLCEPGVGRAAEQGPQFLGGDDVATEREHRSDLRRQLALEGGHVQPPIAEPGDLLRLDELPLALGKAGLGGLQRRDVAFVDEHAGAPCDRIRDRTRVEPVPAQPGGGVDPNDGVGGTVGDDLRPQGDADVDGFEPIDEAVGLAGIGTPRRGIAEQHVAGVVVDRREHARIAHRLGSPPVDRVDDRRRRFEEQPDTSAVDQHAGDRSVDRDRPSERIEGPAIDQPLAARDPREQRVEPRPRGRRHVGVATRLQFVDVGAAPERQAGGIGVDVAGAVAVVHPDGGRQEIERRRLAERKRRQRRRRQ
jgi:hypothetical protein